jgi:hypothetical protein
MYVAPTKVAHEVNLEFNKYVSGKGIEYRRHKLQGKYDLAKKLALHRTN